MKFTAKQLVATLLVTLVYLPLGMSAVFAQEHLPPGLNVIEPPFEYIVGINEVLRTEMHWIMVGETAGDVCEAAQGGGKCATLHFYERQGDSWVLQQSVDFPKPSLVHIKHVGPNRIAVRRKSISTGNSATDVEIAEYELNTSTNHWEATFVLRDYPNQLGYHEGTYLVPCDGVICANISFVDQVNGNWQVTDILYLSTIRTYDNYYITDMQVRDGMAYIMFCGDLCGDYRDIAVVDIEARSFANYFEIQGSGIGKFAVIGNQVLVSASYGDDDFKPPQVYEIVADNWVYMSDAILSHEWAHNYNRIAWNDSTLFESRQARLESESAEAVIFYQQNTPAVWEQNGAILVPNGSGISTALTFSDVYDDSVYFIEGYSDAKNRIFEIVDYHDYLDVDKDYMPLWWEVLYGFSPVFFDDFLGDTDDDGLSDITEYGLQTSPVNSDTDVDQMPDGWEIQYSFNPHDPSDGSQDFDQDGYSNRYEYLNGMDPTFRDVSVVNNVPPSSQGGGAGTTNILWLCLLFIGSAGARIATRMSRVM